MASVSVSPSKEDVASMPLSSLKRLAFVSVRPILQQSYNIFHQNGVNAVVLHCIASKKLYILSHHISFKWVVDAVYDILWAASYRDTHPYIPFSFNNIRQKIVFILMAVGMETEHIN